MAWLDTVAVAGVTVRVAGTLFAVVEGVTDFAQEADVDTADVDSRA